MALRRSTAVLTLAAAASALRESHELEQELLAAERGWGPQAFAEAMANVVKPLHQQWQAFKAPSKDVDSDSFDTVARLTKGNWGFVPEFDGPSCPFYAEGTVVMYCMDKDNYAAKLGKQVPGDIDFGTNCIVHPNRNPVQQFIQTLGEAAKSAFKSVRIMVGALRVAPSEGAGVMLDIHTHGQVPPGRRQKQEVLYCMCDESVSEGVCEGAPLSRLDDLAKLYQMNMRSAKNDKAKIAYIKELSSNGANICGPCMECTAEGCAPSA